MLLWLVMMRVAEINTLFGNFGLMQLVNVQPPWISRWTTTARGKGLGRCLPGLKCKQWRRQVACGLVVNKRPWQFKQLGRSTSGKTCQQTWSPFFEKLPRKVGKCSWTTKLLRFFLLKSLWQFENDSDEKASWVLFWLPGLFSLTSMTGWEQQVARSQWRQQEESWCQDTRMNLPMKSVKMYLQAVESPSTSCSRSLQVWSGLCWVPMWNLLSWREKSSWRASEFCTLAMCRLVAQMSRTSHWASMDWRDWGKEFSGWPTVREDGIWGLTSLFAGWARQDQPSMVLFGFCGQLVANTLKEWLWVMWMICCLVVMIVLVRCWSSWAMNLASVAWRRTSSTIAGSWLRSTPMVTSPSRCESTTRTLNQFSSLFTEDVNLKRPSCLPNRSSSGRYLEVCNGWLPKYVSIWVFILVCCKVKKAP